MHSAVSLIMITTREAVAEDAVAITELTHQLGYNISLEQTLQNIHSLQQSNDHRVFVAADEKVIGWIAVSYNISLESSPTCEIRGLVVAEEFRNKGIGKMLIADVKRWSKGKGVTRLRLRCNTKRTDAHRFYTVAGFTEIKQQKVFEIPV